MVHIYGHAAEMNPILEIARSHQLLVIEDAAEAFGATYLGRIVGSIGEVGTFSFFGNKIITTGEGGTVVTNDDDLAALIRQLKGQGMDPARRYWFPIVGYNYRMTNIQAAIGLAQLEKAEWHLSQRRRVVDTYRKRLAPFPDLHIQPERPGCKNSYWMTSLLLGEGMPERDQVIQQLAEYGIETRPFFFPMHTLPIYQPYSADGKFPVADRVSAHGMNLPPQGA